MYLELPVLAHVLQILGYLFMLGRNMSEIVLGRGAERMRSLGQAFSMLARYPAETRHIRQS